MLSVTTNLLDVTMLMTPGGIPASSARDAKARADKELDGIYFW